MATSKKCDECGLIKRCHMHVVGEDRAITYVCSECERRLGHRDSKEATTKKTFQALTLALVLGGLLSGCAGTLCADCGLGSWGTGHGKVFCGPADVADRAMTPTPDRACPSAA